MIRWNQTINHLQLLLCISLLKQYKVLYRWLHNIIINWVILHQEQFRRNCFHTTSERSSHYARKDIHFWHDWLFKHSKCYPIFYKLNLNGHENSNNAICKTHIYNLYSENNSYRFHVKETRSVLLAAGLLNLSCQ